MLASNDQGLLGLSKPHKRNRDLLTSFTKRPPRLCAIRMRGRCRSCLLSAPTWCLVRWEPARHHSLHAFKFSKKPLARSPIELLESLPLTGLGYPYVRMRALGT